VAWTAEVLDAIVAAEHEVVAIAADLDVTTKPGTGAQRVVAGAALQHVVTVAAEEHVIAVAALQRVVAFEAVEAIVAVVAVQRVVPDVCLELVVTGAAVERDVLARVQRIEEQFGSVGLRDQLNAASEIDRRGAGQIGGIEDEVRRPEDDIHAAREVGVAADQLRERVAFELEPEVQAVRALQVVEAIAVLQILELLLEHEVERRPEEPAEDRLALRHAAGPEVHVV